MKIDELVEGATAHWIQRSILKLPSTDNAPTTEPSLSVDLGFGAESETDDDPAYISVRCTVESEDQYATARFDVFVAFDLARTESDVRFETAEIMEFVTSTGSAYVLGLVRSALLDARNQLNVPPVLIPLNADNMQNYEPKARP